MATKALDLFDAYVKNQLPSEHGFIVTSYFANNSAYSRYEVVSYNNVKSIYQESGGLTFQADGKRLHILIEPANYPRKADEPYLRNTEEKVPQRFSELELHTAKNQSKMYWSKEPQMSYTSFTIMKPKGVDFSFIFYDLPDVYESIALFFEKTFNREAGIPSPDAKKVSKLVAEKLKTTMVGDYS